MGRRTDDDAEFEALFRRSYAPLWRALSLISGDREMAADAVQDAFVQAHRHWPKISTYDNPAGWLRRVALHRLSNGRRGKGRQRAAARRLAAERPGPDGSIGFDVDVAAAVAALPLQQRTAVALFYVADIQIADVAEAMGISSGTVKSHLHDARVNLEGRLGVRDEY